MDLHQLRYVVAIAEAGSFSRAAQQLGMAQPSLSQQVKRLEAEVGQALFDRLPRHVLPTTAGLRLVEHARRILAQVEDARRQLGEAEGVAGPLAVGVIPTIAPFVLPDLLAEYGRRFPAVQISVVEDVTGRLVEAVEQGTVDVAIASATPASRTVHVERVGEEQLLLMLPPEHRLAKRKTAAWPELAGERFLALHEMHCLSGQVSRLCERRSLRTPVVMRGAQLATVAGMVSAGLGVSIVPRMMCSAGHVRGPVCLPFAKDPPVREISAVWSLLRYRTAASRALVDLLRETLKAPGRRAASRDR